MKKAKYLMLTYLMLFAFSFTCSASTTEKKAIKFRDIEWGSSVETVTNALVDSTMIEYKDYGYVEPYLFILSQNVAGMNASILCEFDGNGGLIRGIYNFDVEHTNSQQYYEDYMNLCSKLNGIYGKAEPQEEWTGDSIYKNDPNNKGMAVKIGDLKVETIWQDEDGNYLFLLLSGDNYDCSLSLAYYSKDYAVPNNTDGL